jgi:hypothetical protein
MNGNYNNERIYKQLNLHEINLNENKTNTNISDIWNEAYYLSFSKQINFTYILHFQYTQRPQIKYTQIISSDVG